MYLIPYTDDSQFYSGMYDSSVYELLTYIQSFELGQATPWETNDNVAIYIKRLLETQYIRVGVFSNNPYELTSFGEHWLRYYEKLIGIG